MDSQEFCWQSMGDIDPAARIKILEEALDVAEGFSPILIDAITEAIVSLKQSGGDAGLIQAKFLERCIGEAGECYNRKKCRLLVGVQGQTGAGKSSLLNAILDYEGLLPSSNAEASTAAVCKIRYNHHDESPEPFLAKVIFRSKEDVERELNQYFRDVVERDTILKTNSFEGSGVTEEEKQQQYDEKRKLLDDLNVSIHAAKDKIAATWSLTAGQLAGMDANTLLGHEYKHITRFLDTSSLITGNDPAVFSKSLRPYLDSSYQVLGSERNTVTLWPLVDHVEIQLESDILKTGIVLVDLPGLSDTVGARVEVARRFYDKLDVAVIVAPAIRAADEKTGVDLMTRNQEIALRMDGKFNGRSFCIVVSKIDDIDDRSAALKEGRSDEINAIDICVRECSRYQQNVGSLKARIKKLIRDKDKTKTKQDRQRIKAQLREVRAEKRKERRKGKIVHRQRTFPTGKLAFNAVRSRNKRLTERILNDQKERHHAFKMSQPGTIEYEFVDPDIFPVSAKSYWALQMEDADAIQIKGFPAVKYTGIPAFLHWLQRATFPQRDRHMVQLLHRYCELRGKLFSWAENQRLLKHITVTVPREVIETKVFAANCTAVEQALEKFHTRLVDAIRACDPLKSKVEALKTCRELTVEMVRGWVLTPPDPRLPPAKLAWSTYTAIVRRNGGPFHSTAGGAKRRYNWMEAMADEFKNKIAGGWIEEMHQNVPQLELMARKKIETMWSRIIRRVEASILEAVPELQQHREYLVKQLGVLSLVQEIIKDQVGQALVEFRASSPAVHAGAAKELRRVWEPAFTEAINSPGGPGAFARRRAILEELAKNAGTEGFRLVVTNMEKGMRVAIALFLEAVTRAVREGNTKFQCQLRMMLWNILESAGIERKMKEPVISKEEVFARILAPDDDEVRQEALPREDSTHTDTGLPIVKRERSGTPTPGGLELTPGDAPRVAAQEKSAMTTPSLASKTPKAASTPAENKSSVAAEEDEKLRLKFDDIRSKLGQVLLDWAKEWARSTVDVEMVDEDHAIPTEFNEVKKASNNDSDEGDDNDDDDSDTDFE
ncbi:hypothetical protein OQA88_8220 [Cercophora sp. LCS_1]